MSTDPDRLLADYLRKLFNERQLAEVLGRNAVTLRRWRRLSIGPPYAKIGKTILYDRESVTAWLRAGGAGEGTKQRWPEAATPPPAP